MAHADMLMLMPMHMRMCGAPGLRLHASPESLTDYFSAVLAGRTRLRPAPVRLNVISFVSAM
eukprot:5511767-Prymnesium_polylepis.1